jgi:hypothetical protein
MKVRPAFMISRQCKLGLCASIALSACVSHHLRAQALPDIVPPPKAINLGSTSFFDALGRTEEGFSWLQYGRFENLDRITDSRGKTSAYFKGTSIQVFSALTQIVYASNWHPFGGDAVSFTAAVPLIYLSSDFAADSAVKLRDNGFGIGDLVWGPSYQSRLYRQNDRPVIGFRFSLQILSPTGDFNKRASINQSAGYWAINPYLSVTYLPTASLELSTRLNYQYNLKTSNFAAPPQIPGLIYNTGQAGQICYGNFDASYAVAEKIRLGMNGYFLQSLNPDRTNNQVVPGSEVSAVSLGPGGRYTFNKTNAVNVNVYFPIESRNGSPGPQVNFQIIHRF